MCAALQPYSEHLTPIIARISCDVAHFVVVAVILALVPAPHGPQRPPSCITHHVSVNYEVAVGALPVFLTARIPKCRGIMAEGRICFINMHTLDRNFIPIIIFYIIYRDYKQGTVLPFPRTVRAFSGGGDYFFY